MHIDPLSSLNAKHIPYQTLDQIQLYLSLFVKWLRLYICTRFSTFVYFTLPISFPIMFVHFDAVQCIYKKMSMFTQSHTKESHSLLLLGRIEECGPWLKFLKGPWQQVQNICYHVSGFTSNALKFSMRYLSIYWECFSTVTETLRPNFATSFTNSYTMTIFWQSSG